MHHSAVVNLMSPMPERVKLWREDYAHFASEPVAMVEKLEPLKPLVGNETMSQWMSLAIEGRVDELFESIMTRHYDPCYARSTKRNYGEQLGERTIELPSLDRTALARAVCQMASQDTVADVSA
jgi:tRNA 2-selenouridine synthase